MNKTIISFTENGRKTAEKIAQVTGGDISDGMGKPGFGSAWTKENFTTGKTLIYVGALGIAVRLIEPYVSDKTKDPAVIVVDELGQFVIPVLSGHIGGANEAALEIADAIGGIPVITTATDINGLFAVDVFAKKNNLSIDNMKKAKNFSANLLKGERAEAIISPLKDVDNYSNSPSNGGKALRLIPACLVIGMGCRRGKSYEEINEFFTETLAKYRFDERAVFAITSIDKKAWESGLIELAERLNVPFLTYSEESLMALSGDFTPSEFVRETVGVDNVCERAAICAGAERIIVKKTKKDGMTIAVGIISNKISI